MLDPGGMAPTPCIAVDRYTGNDRDEIERFLTETYGVTSLHHPRRGDEVWFEHTTVATGDVALNRLTSTLPFATTTGPLRQVIVVSPRGGTLTWTTNRHGEVRVADRGVALAPVGEDFGCVVEPCEIDVVALDAPRLADYAAHHCGIAPGTLEFTALRPLSPALARHWLNIVTHVHDDVLANPWAAAQPILRDQAFCALAAALLSTFPNTALDHVTDPDTPRITSEVSPTTLSRILDDLETHEPGMVAALSGLPVHEVLDELRRRTRPHTA
ncbi:hypothetical protein [Actinomycetospora flava]|uniref:AraC family transcriptional regulator n=1 Tax=Actinomycetospora flava TaxID=3129232 RepID=A0ABU8MB05_9PSEU